MGASLVFFLSCFSHFLPPSVSLFLFFFFFDEKLVKAERLLDGRRVESSGEHVKEKKKRRKCFKSSFECFTILYKQIIYLEKRIYLCSVVIAVLISF